MMSKKILHILCAEPDDTVQQFIESISGETGVNVTCLYNDGIATVRGDDDATIRGYATRLLVRLRLARLAENLRGSLFFCG